MGLCTGEEINRGRINEKTKIKNLLVANSNDELLPEDWANIEAWAEVEPWVKVGSLAKVGPWAEVESGESRTWVEVERRLNSNLGKSRTVAGRRRLT